MTKLKEVLYVFPLLCCQLLSSCSSKNDLSSILSQKPLIFRRMAFDQTEGYTSKQSEKYILCKLLLKFLTEQTQSLYLYKESENMFYTEIGQ